MAAAPSSMLYVDLTHTVGAVSIGSIFSIFLLGVVTTQTYTYLVKFWRKDVKAIVFLVCTVWMLDVAHTACVCYDVYRATITLYGQPRKLTTFRGLAATTATGGAITMLVQALYAHRLTRILPRPYNFIGWICMALGSLRFGAAIYLSDYAMHVTNLGHYAGDLSWLISSVLAVGAVIDVVIAVSMLYYLKRTRDGGSDRLVPVIDKLIEYTIRTGALTSVWAVILLILFQTMPDNWAWIAVYMVLSKLYSTSLMSSLNSRVHIRKCIADALDDEGTHHGQASAAMVQFRYIRSQPISVEMRSTSKSAADAVPQMAPGDDAISDRLSDNEQPI